MNYFDLFSLPATFSLDQTRLSATYRDLQKQYHPDKFAVHSDSEQLLAMQKSSEINDGYQTLKNSCSRAQYLLLLAGLDISSEQTTLRDTHFLMEQLQLRETIAEFTEDDEDEIALFAEQIAQRVSTLELQIESQLQADELEVAADSVRKLKFMLKLQAELVLREEKLFD